MNINVSKLLQTALILVCFLGFTAAQYSANAEWNPFKGVPDNALRDYYAADDLFKAGYYERALARINKFSDKYPDNLAGRMLKSWTLLKLDRMDEAKALIDSVLEKDPKHLDALVATGVYYRKLGDIQKAM